MAKIGITKEFKFEAAHYLPGYDGSCSVLHGHSYKLAVSVTGPIDAESGMVLDFSKLKLVVNEEIIFVLDHTYLNDCKLADFPSSNPTAENMVSWMGARLSPLFVGMGLELVMLRLWETDTSFATWTVSDLAQNITNNDDNAHLLFDVHSIFESISGEAGFIPQGSWCTFIRLQGCNLQCPWCDTKESQNGIGKKMSLSEIMNQVGQRQVIITGGEPLMQRNILALIRALLTAGKKVQVETNGTYAIPEDLIYDKVGWVVDYKAPSTNPKFPFMAFHSMFQMNMPKNIMIKFVIDQDIDLIHAFQFINSRIKQPFQEQEMPMFIFSGMMALDEKSQVWRNRMPEIIADIKEKWPELLPHVIFSLQMHKLMNVA